MKNPVNIFLALLLIGVLGWVIYSNKPSNEGESASTSIAAKSVDISGSTVNDIEGTAMKFVETKNENGQVTETGFMLDGLKAGTWTTYFDGMRVKSISTYAAGKLHGQFMEFSNRGHVEKEVQYVNGIYHGKYTTYKSGSRKLEERQYNMGKLDGVLKKYDDRRGKLQQEIYYKNDKQHGPYRYYDEEGNITMEYEYKDGEKVSGGIIKE